MRQLLQSNDENGIIKLVNQKGFAPLIVLTTILLVVLVGGIYYLKSSSASHSQIPTPIPTSQASPSTYHSAASPLPSNFPPQDTSTTAIFDVTVTSSGSPKNVTLDTQDNLKKITLSVGSFIYLHSQSNAYYTYLLYPTSGVIELVQGTINLPMNDFALLKAVGPGTSTITVSKQSQGVKNSNKLTN